MTVILAVLVVVSLLALGGLAVLGIAGLAVLLAVTGLWPYALTFTAGATASAAGLAAVVLRRDERTLWNEVTARAFAEAGDRLVDQVEALEHIAPGGAS